MKTLIIESTCKTKPFKEDYSDTSIVHVRNSLILQESLGADLLIGEYQLEDILQKEYDNIICCYASPYMPHIPYRKIIDKNKNAQLYWLVNDHDLEDNQLLRYAILQGRNYRMICNNPREGYRGWILRKNINGKKLNDFITEWLTVNLNSLIMRESKVSAQEKVFNGIYYGTFRKHRSKDFQKHLTEGIHCSASKKLWKKYDAIGCKCEMLDKLSWEKEKETLAQYKYSLYIEDEHTHDNYAFMANRFYEALMTDTVMLFAENTKNTIQKSPYKNLIDQDFIIQGEDRFIDKINKSDYQSLINKQNEFYSVALKEKQETLAQVKEFLEKGK